MPDSQTPSANTKLKDRPLDDRTGVEPGTKGGYDAKDKDPKSKSKTSTGETAVSPVGEYDTIAKQAGRA